MSKPESWQVSTEAAEVYESSFMPAIFGAWAGPVADVTNIKADDHVLDVACGTGALAREAFGRIGPQGRVVGLDLNEGMLAVAARIEPRIEWCHGDAGELPFEDKSYQVVASQFALMYFPDRVTALSEMWRVLAPGGRLTVATWAPITRALGYEKLVDITTRRCGQEAADVLAAPFVLGDTEYLSSLFTKAGVTGAQITLNEGSIRFPSVTEFVRCEVKGSPLADILDDNEMGALTAEAESALAEFIEPSGEIVMQMDANITMARKN